MAATEGQQVMALISKRLRTHRKKYNRITEMEESISQELEKLRLPPPSAAVSEEIISLPAKKNKKQKARKEIAPEEKDVTSKTDMEDCKVSDEVSKDDISPCSESSQDVTPSPPSTSSGKARRKKKSKKPQTTN
ncbi:BnaC03g29820D [Brassica napus]|uniref:BnaC03g29820D protein n=1 Tax=Brassica napus TaxID=3708 RepID=A0A078G981_BRANA|nr:BnaC03g29820D [Brassica napus]